MVRYHLRYTLQSLEGPVNAMEFSPNGQFLIVGESQPPRLRVLDRLAGFRPVIETDAISQPTSFVFESSTAFLAGHDDGRFVEYRIDLKSRRLIEGWTNNLLRGPSPVSALALNETSRILALAVGPSVFVFHRISGTGEFQFIANISRYFDLGCNPIRPPPIPASLCFSSDGQLHVAFYGQHVASVKLVFERYSGLQTAFPGAVIDYSGLSILKAVLPSGKAATSDFSRFWIYGCKNVPGFGDDAVPFLFINDGAATLSASSSGVALIRNVVTQRLMQSLRHDDVTTRPLTIAYHSGRNIYAVATANCDSVKVWNADKIPNSHQPTHASKSRFWNLTMAMIVFAVAMLSGGNFFDKHQTVLLHWIQYCCTAVTHIEVIVEKVLEELYRDIEGKILWLAGEEFGRR